MFASAFQIVVPINVQSRQIKEIVILESLGDCRIHTHLCALTSNRTHFLVRSEEPGLISHWMQEVEGQFAQAYNPAEKAVEITLGRPVSLHR